MAESLKDESKTYLHSMQHQSEVAHELLQNNAGQIPVALLTCCKQLIVHIKLNARHHGGSTPPARSGARIANSHGRRHLRCYRQPAVAGGSNQHLAEGLQAAWSVIFLSTAAATRLSGRCTAATNGACPPRPGRTRYLTIALRAPVMREWMT